MSPPRTSTIPPWESKSAWTDDDRALGSGGSAEKPSSRRRARGTKRTAAGPAAGWWETRTVPPPARRPAGRNRRRRSLRRRASASSGRRPATAYLRRRSMSRCGSGQHLESRPEGQAVLPGVEGQERLGTQRASRGHMEEIHCPDPEGLRVNRAQGLRLAKQFLPWQRA